VTSLNIVNIQKPKKPKVTILGKNTSDHSGFVRWIIPGVILSLLFLLLALRYKNFIVFIPVGPIASIFAWYVKRFVKKFETKPKKYSS
jgi:hypothetical protein